MISIDSLIQEFSAKSSVYILYVLVGSFNQETETRSQIPIYFTNIGLLLSTVAPAHAQVHIYTRRHLYIYKRIFRERKRYRLTTQKTEGWPIYEWWSKSTMTERVRRCLGEVRVTREAVVLSGATCDGDAREARSTVVCAMLEW